MMVLPEVSTGLFIVFHLVKHICHVPVIFHLHRGASCFPGQFYTFGKCFKGFLIISRLRLRSTNIIVQHTHALHRRIRFDEPGLHRIKTVKRLFRFKLVFIIEADVRQTVHGKVSIIHHAGNMVSFVTI